MPPPAVATAGATAAFKPVEDKRALTPAAAPAWILAACTKTHSASAQAG